MRNNYKYAIVVFALLVAVTSFAQVKVDQAKNVGIGTDTPTGKLEVVGNTTINGNTNINGNANILNSRNTTILNGVITDAADGGNESVYIGVLSGSEQGETSNRNVGIGRGALFRALGIGNIGIGYNAGLSIENGTNNIMIGTNAGHQGGAIRDVNHSTYIGAAAGYTNAKDYRLYISQNQGAMGTLIYGEFDNKLVNINDRLEAKHLDIINARSTLVVNQEFAFHDTDFTPNDASWYSTYLGRYSGQNQTTDSKYNVGVGNSSLKNSQGTYNVGVGFNSGRALLGGTTNTMVGANSMNALNSGSKNTAIGYSAGKSATTSDGSVYLGFQAGYYNNQSNRLYIENTSTNSPLVYGEFDNNLLRVNGTFEVNGEMQGGFGAKTTSGPNDWNAAQNSKSGTGLELLTGNAPNGPGGGKYYHPFTYEYGAKDGTGNRTQYAIPYNGKRMFFRTSYSGVWSDWHELLTNEGFNTSETSLTANWDDYSDPGFSKTLLHGTASTNGTGAANYFYATNMVHIGNNRTQVAWPYNADFDPYYRTRYNGTWKDWTKLVTSRDGEVEVEGKLKVGDVINLPLTNTEPSNPSTGDIYLDNGANTDDGQPSLRFWSGSAWTDL